jgi:plasmid maintenance system antidote protein VapI
MADMLRVARRRGVECTGPRSACGRQRSANGRHGITADTAFRLARYFGTTPEFWINLQARYDLDLAERTLRRWIEREVRPRAA